MTPKHRASFCSLVFSNDSKLSCGWCLVLPLFSDSLSGGSVPPIANFLRLFQLLVNQSDVHLWHPNFRNGIEQTTPESFVHCQHIHRIFHKIFRMFFRRSYIFIENYWRLVSRKNSRWPKYFPIWYPKYYYEVQRTRFNRKLAKTCCTALNSDRIVRLLIRDSKEISKKALNLLIRLEIKFVYLS